MRKTMYAVLIIAALCLLCACGSTAHTLAPQELTAQEVLPTPTPTPTARVPRITLNNGAQVEWPCGIAYVDAGFTAVDADGADISSAVECSGQVDCMNIGEYKLAYTVTAEGMTVEAQRTVRVVSVGYPAVIQPEEKVIYLTFDDGPCANTQRLLDTLARYDAKATFFVIGGGNAYFDELVPKIYAAGHSLGVHADNHQYNKLYTDAQTYLNDLIAVRERIYDLTGEYVYLCRFPGGSTTAYNMLKNRDADAWQEVKQQLERMGIQYFDWNVKPENDMGSAASAVAAVKSFAPEYTVPVVLQHDTRLYSVAAVEKILKWGTENGYSFRGLDVTVPPVHDRAGDVIVK